MFEIVTRPDSRCGSGYAATLVNVATDNARVTLHYMVRQFYGGIWAKTCTFLAPTCRATSVPLISLRRRQSAMTWMPSTVTLYPVGGYAREHDSS